MGRRDAQVQDLWESLTSVFFHGRAAREAMAENEKLMRLAEQMLDEFVATDPLFELVLEARGDR